MHFFAEIYFLYQNIPVNVRVSIQEVDLKLQKSVAYYSGCTGSNLALLVVLVGGIDSWRVWTFIIIDKLQYTDGRADHQVGGVIFFRGGFCGVLWIIILIWAKCICQTGSVEYMFQIKLFHMNESILFHVQKDPLSLKNWS